MMRRFLKDQSGTVLVESLIAMPILVLFTFVIVQLGYVFFVSSTMIHVSQHISREIAVGGADDETNGTYTACGSLTGVSADGLESAESMACDMMANIPGDFSVFASDTVAGGAAMPGDSIQVSIRIQTIAMIPIDAMGMADSFATYSVSARHIKE